MNIINKYNIKDWFSASIAMESKINNNCKKLATHAKDKVKRLIDSLEKSKYAILVKVRGLLLQNLVNTAKEKD